MTISQRAQRFWTWFDTARFGLSFMHEVQAEEQESMLMNLYSALQEYYPGLTFAIKVEKDGSSAHLIIYDDGKPVSKRRNKQLFQHCLSFSGWTFGMASGNPLLQDLPDLTDELENCKGVYVDLLAVHASDEDPRFLIFIYVPAQWERGFRAHLEYLVRLFIGPERFESLVHSVVFAPAGKTLPRGCVPIGKLQSWVSRIQSAHLVSQDPIPLYRDQIEELN